MVRARAACAALALVGASLVSITGPVLASPARPAVDSVSWGECSDPFLVDIGAECGSLAVPMDHADPTGPTVTLALSRVRHTVPDADYQGIMLVNPGGPGGSGLGLSFLGYLVPDGVGAAYDWIGFDPRGVGESTPRVSCDPGYLGFNRPDYVPATAAEEQLWLTRAQGYAAACSPVTQPLLAHMHTTDVAQDVDDIRAALGQEKLNWYGFSYGTYIGQVYATLFPQRVRRMVLDGVIDPGRVFYNSNLDQNAAFDVVSRVWFRWIADHDATYHLGSTESEVADHYYALRASLKGHAVQGKIGPSEFDDIFLSAGYAQFLWPFLTPALAAAYAGDLDVLLNYYGGPGDDNFFAVYAATECTDAVWPTAWPRWHQDSERYYAKAPFLTWGNTWFNAECAFWQVPPAKRLHITGNGTGSILLVNQTLDAATPYSGALAVRTLFQHSVLVAEPGGTTHAGSLNGNACTDGVIADYLATGTLPARRPGTRADVLCAPLPEPEPFIEAPVPASLVGSLRLAARYRLQTLR